MAFSFVSPIVSGYVQIQQKQAVNLFLSPRGMTGFTMKSNGCWNYSASETDLQFRNRRRSLVRKNFFL